MEEVETQKFRLHPAELFKAAGTNFNSAFHQLLLQIWNAEWMPTEIRESLTCPIHSKTKQERLNFSKCT
uniref:Uncharacterized protein n=1 Tax=Megaselia scalaris TaxID=36166 RepID=T1G9Y8_MEGSC